MLKGFISYSHDDEEIRSALVAQLNSLSDAGLARFWTDQQLRAGNAWEARIARELLNADIALFVVSPASMSKDRYVRTKELALAKRLACSSSHDTRFLLIPTLAKRYRYEPFFSGVFALTGVQPAPAINRWIEDCGALSTWCAEVETSLWDALKEARKSRHSGLLTPDLASAIDAARGKLDECERLALEGQAERSINLASAFEGVSGALSANPFDLRGDLRTAQFLLARTIQDYGWPEDSVSLKTDLLMSLIEVEKAAIKSGCPDGNDPPTAERELAASQDHRTELERIQRHADWVQDDIRSLANRGDSLDPAPIPELLKTAEREIDGKHALIRSLIRARRIDVPGLRSVIAGLAMIALGVAFAGEAEGANPGLGGISELSRKLYVAAEAAEIGFGRIFPVVKIDPAVQSAKAAEPLLSKAQEPNQKLDLPPEPEPELVSGSKEDPSRELPPPKRGLFDSLWSWRSKDMAIDIGTGNTRVYVRGRGVQIDEPSVVAYVNQNGRKIVHAVGKEAKMMLGKTPIYMEAVRPMRDGVIADFEVAEEMIKRFIQKVQVRRSFIAPIIIICVPAGATPVERRAIHQSAQMAGARAVYLIDESMAVAVGAGLPIDAPSGMIIVDVGETATTTSIVSQGAVVYSRRIRVGDDKMNDAIVNYLRREENLLIGEASAERIKKEVGTAKAPESGKGKSILISGRDLMNGAPKEIKVTEAMTAKALRDAVEQIADSVKSAREAMPPELAEGTDSAEHVLVGAGATLHNLATVIGKKAELKFKLADEPERVAVIGAGKVLENFAAYKRLLAPEV